MSNTIAHLAVAQKILINKPDLAENRNAFFLGSIAPDTIGSKPGCTRSDKKSVHLRDDIPDADWLSDEKMLIFNARIQQFTAQFINCDPIPYGHRDFNTGYLVHLLTDKWNHKTIRQKMLQIANASGIQESDRSFYNMVMNDLEALDNYLFRNHSEIRNLFAELTGNPIKYDLPGFIERAYIERSVDWWKNQYLPNIEKRKLMHISESDINEFVNLAAAGISKELELLIET